MVGTRSLPRLLVAFYANPDHYPPTYNAVNLLRSRFDVRIISRRSVETVRDWPPDVRHDRVGPGRTGLEGGALSLPRKVAEFVGFVAVTHSGRSRASSTPTTLLRS